MVLQVQVLAENARTHNGVEYVTVTALEIGPTPLLQMVDYGLRDEEKSHKGKLVGKSVRLQVENVRAIFSGRPQLTGRILEVSGNGK